MVNEESVLYLKLNINFWLPENFTFRFVAGTPTRTNLFLLSSPVAFPLFLCHASTSTLISSSTERLN